jgi:hypothetical protein
MRRWLEHIAELEQDFRWREACVDGKGWIDVVGCSDLDWECMGGVKQRLERRAL